MLRLALGGLAVVVGSARLAPPNWPAGVGTLTAVALIVSAVALLVGFLTPMASVAAGTGCLAVAIAGSTPVSTHWLATVSGGSFAAAVALAVALLGPGAFSVDARLFGRRQVVIPARDAR